MAGLFLAVAARETYRHATAVGVASEIKSLGGTVYWNPEVHETIIRDLALTRITDVCISNPNFPDKGFLYVETVEHGLGPLMGLLGKKQLFTWKIEGNLSSHRSCVPVSRRQVGKRACQNAGMDLPGQDDELGHMRVTAAGAG
jgi:hypothetical protein